MKNRYGLLFLLIGIGFVLRAYLAVLSTVIDVDGTFMALLAQDISTGKAYFRSIIPPLFSYLMVFAFPFFQGFEEAGRMVSVVMGTAALPLIYLLGRYFFSPKVGLIATALAVFEPNLLFYSSSVLSESTYLVLFLGASMLSYCLIKKPSFLLSAVVGIVWGLTYLTRQEGAILCGLLVLIFVGFLLIRKISLIKGVVIVAFICLGFFAVSLPYLQFIKKTTGDWALSDKSLLHIRSGIESIHFEDRNRVEKFLFTLTPDKKSVVSQELISNSALREQYKPKFNELVEMYVKNVAICLKIGLPQWLPFLIYLFLGIGLYGVIKNRDSKWLWLLPLSPCYLLFPFIYYQNRFLFTLIPFCLVLAAYGVAIVSTRFTQKKWGVVAIIMVVFVSVVPNISSEIQQRQGKGDFLKEVGSWLEKNYPSGSRFMARYPQIPFYGGGVPVPLPYAPLEDIVVNARFQNINAIILRRSVVERFRPWLLPLFLDPDSVEALQLIYRAKNIQETSEDEVLIYGLK